VASAGTGSPGGYPTRRWIAIVLPVSIHSDHPDGLSHGQLTRLPAHPDTSEVTSVSGGKPVDQHIRTHILHIDSSCADKACPAVVDVSATPGHKAVVGKIVTDPAIAAALGQHIGAGEAVVLIPDNLYRQIQEG